MSTIAIIAVGSRGDVAPLTGIGMRLKQAGHRVVMAAYTPFADVIAQCGMDFCELPVDFNPGEDHVEGQPAREVASLLLPGGMRAMGQQILAALHDVAADLLLLPPFSELAGHPLAEARGIPSAGVRLQPLSATGAYPPAVLGAWSIGATGNRLVANAGAWAVDRLYRGVVDDFRRDLGLPTRSTRTLRRHRTQANWPILHGYSPTVLPRPVDWRPEQEVVGYWWPAPMPGWKPSETLTDFLAAGPAPVFVGLGSTVTSAGRAEQISDIIRQVTQRARVRAVVQTGWAGLKVTADDVLTIGEVPHEWLFPQMAAAIHHCGAGTTAAALRAGIPSIAIPGAMGDQSFWAMRLRDLGASAATIPQRALKVESLAGTVRTAMTDHGLHGTAQYLARRIGDEDGASRVLAVVESLLHQST